MTKKRIKRIIIINEKIGASLIMIGTVFNLQHWTYGKIILIFGIILGGGSLFYEKFILQE
jgi:hypothetical protein